MAIARMPSYRTSLPDGVEDEIGRRALEVEASSPTTADSQQDSKRMRKLVPTVSLAMAALCCAIYASIPQTIQLRPRSPLVYDFLLAFISLGVLTSLGLIMSIMRSQGTEATWVQKKLLLVDIFFASIAFVLRIALHPVASFGYIGLVFFSVAAVIALCLYVAWKKNHQNQTARAPDSPLPISVPRSDGGGN